MHTVLYIPKTKQRLETTRQIGYLMSKKMSLPLLPPTAVLRTPLSTVLSTYSTLKVMLPMPLGYGVQSHPSHLPTLLSSKFSLSRPLLHAWRHAPCIQAPSGMKNNEASPVRCSEVCAAVERGMQYRVFFIDVFVVQMYSIVYPSSHTLYIVQRREHMVEKSLL